MKSLNQAFKPKGAIVNNLLNLCVRVGTSY